MSLLKHAAPIMCVLDEHESQAESLQISMWLEHVDYLALEICDIHPIARE